MKAKVIQARWMAAGAAFMVWASEAATFDDVQFWVGQGTNRAILVIDWADGLAPEALFWGYQWDGDATGLDMLLAVVRADWRLFGHLGQFGWGTAVFGLGYDRDGDGAFGVSPDPGFDAAGVAWSTNPNDSRVATDAEDHWREGWNSGYWAYYLKSDEASAWGASMVGAADRVLTDGVWDGWRFAPGFTATPPGSAVPAVPEPSTLGMLLLGLGAGAWLCRRSRM